MEQEIKLQKTDFCYNCFKIPSSLDMTEINKVGQKKEDRTMIYNHLQLLPGELNPGNHDGLDTYL
jgi:hypothetical protein